MNLFAKLLGSDIRYGLGVAVVGRIVLVAAVSALVLFLSYTVVLIKLPELHGRLTFGETMLCMFRGMMPYSPQSGRPFLLPMGWLSLLITMLYVTSDYPFRDLGGMGAHAIVACRSRWTWWLSKCSWAIACVFVCFAIAVAFCAAMVIVGGGDWSLGVRSEVAGALNAGDAVAAIDGSASVSDESVSKAGLQDGADLGLALTAFVLAFVALSLVQLVAGLFVHPVIGLALSISILLFSAFFKRWYLLGNYLMLARTRELMRGGLDPLVGCALALSVCVGATVIGGLAFGHKDILGRRGDAG